MSLALDYLGKYILVLVALAVGVGMILSLQGYLDTSELVPGDKKDTESKIVELEGGHRNRVQKVKGLVSLCYDQVLLEETESQTCYLVRTAEGNFDMGKEEISSGLDPEVREKTDFKKEKYTRQVIVISYDFGQNRIEVDE